MRSVICHFSGAGNSKTVAHDLSTIIGSDAVLPIGTLRADPSPLEGVETLGLVFPVYFFGPPGAIKRFILETLRESQARPSYLFVVLTHGGMPLYAPSITDRLLAESGFAASYVQTLSMVDTYIPLFAIPGENQLAARHERISKRVQEIGEEIARQEMKVATRLPMARLIHSLWDGSLDARASQDRKFRVTADCTGCGICAKTCPVGNITMEKNRPQYHQACEQCLGCYHHCPEHAIRLQKRPLRGYSWYVPPKSFITKERVHESS